MKTQVNKNATRLRVGNLSGSAYIWHSGKGIFASGEHKHLLPTGAVHDENPSYYTIRDPDSWEIAIFMSNLASADQ